MGRPVTAPPTLHPTRGDIRVRPGHSPTNPPPPTVSGPAPSRALHATKGTEADPGTSGGDLPQATRVEWIGSTSSAHQAGPVTKQQSPTVGQAKEVGTPYNTTPTLSPDASTDLAELNSEPGGPCKAATSLVQHLPADSPNQHAMQDHPGIAPEMAP